MQYIEFKKQLKDFLIFSIKDIEKIDFDFHKQRLSEWQKKDYIKKIAKGFYIFSDTEINELALFIMANKIHAPSYISLEMALSIYNVIPEAVYGVTSVTTDKTKSVKTSFATFVYRHIRSHLMFGYELIKYKNYYYQLAELEKAILDYLYFNPKIKDKESFDGMRFNIPELKKKINKQKFYKYLETFNKKSLNYRAEKLISYIYNYA